MLHTGYASVAGPVLAFTGRLREQRAEQIVVLIPVATPDRPRYRFPHDHLDLMLAAALYSRPGIVTARVPVLLHGSLISPPGGGDEQYSPSLGGPPGRHRQAAVGVCVPAQFAQQRSRTTGPGS